MFKEIESYAREHEVPIMSRQSVEFVSNVIKNSNSRSLLEVGTAIAYSTLFFSRVECIEFVDTIERDTSRFEIALKNIKLFDEKQCITPILTDALKHKNRKSYDAVFLDAAKAQNEALFKLYFAFTNKVMIIDNVDFHGFTGHSSEIRSRNLRQMIKRIESFLRYLETRSDLIVQKYDIGDGVLVITRKG